VTEVTTLPGHYNFGVGLQNMQSQGRTLTACQVVLT